jgi:hypothetical protein
VRDLAAIAKYGNRVVKPMECKITVGNGRGPALSLTRFKDL